MSDDPDPEDGDDAERRPERVDGEARDEPLAELADRVRRSRSEREGRERTGEGTDDDPFAALERAADEAGGTGSGGTTDDDPFERVEVEDIDGEDVWESLEGEEPAAERSAIDAGADAERVEREDPGAERPDHVVEKSAYCQRCRFLSAPPEVRCTHEGTAIVEVVDSERFRVRGCPMVAEGGAVDRDPDHDRDAGD